MKQLLLLRVAGSALGRGAVGLHLGVAGFAQTMADIFPGA